MTLLYATTNPGKLFEVGKYLKQFGVEVISPADVGISLDIEENGTTFEENATLKATAYLDTGVEYLVLADDTGIEIDALDGEPGVHAGRWKDGKTRMTDEEVIAYCLERIRNVPNGKRGAQFRTVIAVGMPRLEKRDRENIELFDGTLRGVILEKPAPLRIRGFPFESLFYIPQWNMVLGDVHQLPAEKKRKFLTHRERAVEKALPRIRSLFGSSRNFKRRK